VANVDERLSNRPVQLNLNDQPPSGDAEQGGEIILSTREEPGRVFIDVTDTGRGMLPETLARIFDAYYSTKKGGAGLGLAISAPALPRSMVDHRGQRGGKGSVFTMEFPLVGNVPRRN